MGIAVNNYERATFTFILDEDKAEEEIRIRRHKTGLKMKGIIYNNSIVVD